MNYMSRKPPIPFWDSPKGHCRWCGESILKPDGSPNLRRNWHPECVKVYHIATSSTHQRRACKKRDKGVCLECRNRGDSWEWEADHIVPLWSVDRSLPHNEIIKFWLVENLQTLCSECHTKKTSREATERAERKRKQKGQLNG